jgi:hypothetical protein
VSLASKTVSGPPQGGVGGEKRGADETRTCLRVAEALGILELQEIQAPLELIDRVLAMLWRLCR